MAEKAKNYTAEQTAELVAAYTACESEKTRVACVAEFAQKFAKNLQSVRSKLVSEGVYVAKTYKTKKGNKPESKALIVSDIARFLGVSSEAVESLEKANKAALTLIRGTLSRLPE